MNKYTPDHCSSYFFTPPKGTEEEAYMAEFVHELRQDAADDLKLSRRAVADKNLNTVRKNRLFEGEPKVIEVIPKRSLATRIKEVFTGG